MRKLATCVTGLLIVALVLGAIGCGGGMSTADLVKWLPVGCEAYMSVDIKAVRQDPDLAPLSQSLQMAEYTEFGIDVSEVDYVAMAVRGDDDALMLLIGKVDREWMRLRLSGLGFEEGKYQGAEIWTRSGIGRPSMGFALMDDKTVIGRTLDGTRQCIRALKGVGGSAYENRDLKDVVERLPKGIVVMGALSGELMEDLPECLAIAASFQPAVGETLRATFVAKFPDEAAAERGRPAFEEDPDMFDVEVVRDGRFLEATAIMPLSELGQVGSAQTTTPTPTPKPPATIRSTALSNAPTNLGAEAMASG